MKFTPSIKMPRIKVSWVTDPRSIDDCGILIPVLTINSKVMSIYRLDGQRPKYVGKDFVIKIDCAIDAEETGDYYAQSLKEIELWEKFDLEDRKYFPELLRASVKDRWTAQNMLILHAMG